MVLLLFSNIFIFHQKYDYIEIQMIEIENKVNQNKYHLKFYVFLYILIQKKKTIKKIIFAIKILSLDLFNYLLIMFLIYLK